LKPFFSVTVIVKKQPHLLSYTIESILAQKSKDYEINLIVDSIYDVRSVVKEYQKYLRYVNFVKEKGISGMMNEGIMQAKGRYLQFVSSGDSYMSVRSIGEMVEFFKNNDYPDFAFSPFILRDNEILPKIEVRQFAAEYLKSGKIPTRLACSFFSIDILRDMHGFDKRYESRECFDLFCRLFTQSKSKFIFYPKVIVDYIPCQQTSQEAFMYYFETLMIVLRNFGFKEVLGEWIRGNYFTLFKLWLKSLKKNA
jgi:glycosyltransferase involved in cell wall biosynthesis